MMMTGLADPKPSMVCTAVYPTYTGSGIDEGVGDMSAESGSSGAEPKGFDRRTFLHTSGGVATGIAVTVFPSGVVALAGPAAASAKDKPQLVDPSGHPPAETVMAYVHDADAGIVTVVSGIEERTYRDPALAKRLIDAARPQTT
jgi:hypothetical protein